MRMTDTTVLRRLALTGGIALAICLAGSPALAGFEESKTFTSDHLVINNLIGEIHVQGHGGSSFEVVVKVDGRDASRESIRLRSDGDQLSVVFPISDERNYVYPRMGRGSSSTFSPDRGGSWLSEVLDGVLGRNIKVSGSGRGMEVWADIEVRIPRGASLRVNHGVGEVEVSDATGDLQLNTQSGRIAARNVDGNLMFDTGSGHVTVEQAKGTLGVDTGSGSVELTGCRCRKVDIDTGSGSVEAHDVETDELRIDTGSGRIRASGVAADQAELDTGSGSISLQLDRMGSGNFKLDTGSGSITLGLPANASADIRASTGSGGIDLDLDEGVKLRRKERDELSFSIGAGAARVTLDTGSGGIRIVRSD